jgi:hypothetical protein
MNGSLYTADRAMHRRILLTACAGALLVVIITLGARGPFVNQLQVLAPTASSATCSASPSSPGCDPV